MLNVDYILTELKQVYKVNLLLLNTKCASEVFGNYLGRKS